MRSWGRRTRESENSQSPEEARAKQEKDLEQKATFALGEWGSDDPRYREVVRRLSDVRSSRTESGSPGPEPQQQQRLSEFRSSSTEPGSPEPEPQQQQPQPSFDMFAGLDAGPPAADREPSMTPRGGPGPGGEVGVEPGPPADAAAAAAPPSHPPGRSTENMIKKDRAILYTLRDANYALVIKNLVENCNEWRNTLSQLKKVCAEGAAGRSCQELQAKQNDIRSKRSKLLANLALLRYGTLKQDNGTVNYKPEEIYTFYEKSLEKLMGLCSKYYSKYKYIKTHKTDIAINVLDTVFDWKSLFVAGGVGWGGKALSAAKWGWEKYQDWKGFPPETKVYGHFVSLLSDSLLSEDSRPSAEKINSEREKLETELIQRVSDNLSEKAISAFEYIFRDPDIESSIWEPIREQRLQAVQTRARKDKWKKALEDWEKAYADANKQYTAPIREERRRREQGEHRSKDTVSAAIRDFFGLGGGGKRKKRKRTKKTKRKKTKKTKKRKRIKKTKRNKTKKRRKTKKSKRRE